MLTSAIGLDISDVQQAIVYLKPLIRLGTGAYVMFVIQMKGPHTFTPHVERDEKFARNLLRAKKAGVEVLAYDTIVTAGDIRLDAPVKICLPGEEMML